MQINKGENGAIHTLSTIGVFFFFFFSFFSASHLVLIHITYKIKREIGQNNFSEASLNGSMSANFDF